jgi:hypothetical protein
MEPDMRSELRREAAQNGRSLHGEIIQRLKESLKGPAQNAQAA